MKKNRKTLNCSCCGKNFKGYQDPDHDLGFGTCPRCEDWIVREFVGKREALIRSFLSEDNKVLFDQLSEDKREEITIKAVEDKIIL